MPKLYTKSGDNGETSLYDGNRRPKSSIFFDVLGDIDELSSHIGVLHANIDLTRRDHQRAKCMLQHRSDCYEEKEGKYDACLINLREIQIKLFDISSNIAVIDEKKRKNLTKISGNDVKKLEGLIDECEAKNDRLTEFLVYGTQSNDAQCHVCRSLARRVERSLWKLEHIGEGYDNKNNSISVVKVDNNILRYMNRLSDFFFALARNLARSDIKVRDIKKKLATYK